MEKLKRCLIFIKNGSAEKLLLTVIRTVWYNSQIRILKIRDALLGSGKSYKEAGRGLRPVKITGQKLDVSGISGQKAEALWRLYREHRFDLLGSGWVKNSFSLRAGGFEGFRYENPAGKAEADGQFLKRAMGPRDYGHAKEIYSLIDADYEPVDWQIDFKSGYRWGADRWYRPQETAKGPGGDIKVPWELSRLQQLPRLAVLGLVLPEQKELIFREFRNQLLDFIAQNPVRKGVNHMCTMDVGIRTANIALACSLWKGMGREFDREFERAVTNYLFEECDFIRRNLEWSYYLTSNHYFADIAGLLWGSAVLPPCGRRDRWLRFARGQLLKEIRKQFYAEGSNGEGSTAYHRLTGEMALYSAALIHELARTEGMRDAQEDIYRILLGGGFFTDAVTRPDGMFTQIGDNDSGLFFRLSITGRIDADGNPDENLNDGRPYASAVCGMFDAPGLLPAAKRYPLEYSLVREIMGDERFKLLPYKTAFKAVDRPAAADYVKTYEIRRAGALRPEKLIRIDYPEFGIYVFKSEECYLCFNASDNGQKGNAGHAHNDKLSFELFLHGECVFEDPGTYVYTALPELRDRFRSTKYHNTVYCGEEQNRFQGLFSMYNDTRCFITGLEQNAIEAQVEYRGIIHRRRVEIFEDFIRVTDCCNRPFEQQFEQKPVARGYGKLER